MAVNSVLPAVSRGKKMAWCVEAACNLKQPAASKTSLYFVVLS